VLTIRKTAIEILSTHYLDIIVTLLLYIGVGIVHWLFVPFDTFFLEQDATLSFPFKPDSSAEVPSLWAIILAVPVPMIITFSLQLFMRCCPIPESRPTTAPERVKKAIDPILDLFLSQLVFLEAHAMQLFIVEFLKSFLGRKRPNFFFLHIATTKDIEKQ